MKISNLRSFKVWERRWMIHQNGLDKAEELLKNSPVYESSQVNSTIISSSGRRFTPIPHTCSLSSPNFLPNQAAPISTFPLFFFDLFHPTSIPSPVIDHLCSQISLSNFIEHFVGIPNEHQSAQSEQIYAIRYTTHQSSWQGQGFVCTKHHGLCSES